MSAFIDHLRGEIRRVLYERNLSVRQVAESAGVPNSSLNDFLNGNRGMQLENVGAVIDWLRAQPGAPLALPDLPAGTPPDGTPVTRGDVSAMIATALRPFGHATTTARKSTKRLHTKIKRA